MAKPYVQFRFSTGGLLAACTFTPAPVAGRTPAQVAADAKLFWNAMKTYTYDQTFLTEIAVHIDAGDAVVPYNEAGGWHSTALPPNCAAVFTKVTAAGRKGRLFWPGVPTAAFDNVSGWIAGSAANYNTAAATGLAAMEAAGTQMHVWHKTGPTSHVTSLVLTKTLGTQRRRLRN